MRIATQNFSLSASRTYILIIISALCYFIFAYYTQRHFSTSLITLYSVLFIAYLLIQKTELPLNQILFAGFFFRAIFLVSLPFLSQDFYRYIWDGHLTAGGINPFILTPSTLIDDPSISAGGINRELFQLLNSPDFHSVYPPVSQFFFWLAALAGKGNILTSVIVLRLTILLAEAGSVYMLTKLFKTYHFDQKFIGVYVLNPLIIIEFSGNLHFEALMIFFILTAVFFMKKKQYIVAGAFLALSISTKLLPVIFLPFILKRIRFRDAAWVYLTTGAVTLLTFLPVINTPLLNGFTASFTTYFQKFEFNASVFYITREVGLIIGGVNSRETVALVLAAITFVLIIVLAITERKEKNLLLGIFVWALSIYLVFSPAVYPWYITPLIAFCLFSRFRFPIIWSYLIFLSYLGYSERGYLENPAVLIIQYAVVFGMAAYEIFLYKPFELGKSDHNLSR